MINYVNMPYGYSFDMNITDRCNIRCKHCYMEKSDLALSFEDVQKIFNKLPLSLNRLVLSGGEPFVNYETLYETIKFVRTKFMPSLVIRITSNGKYFYDSDQHIENELTKMDNYGVNEIMFSTDQYHYKAGIDKCRLTRIGEICSALCLNLKVKYLDIGKGIPVGQFMERDENLISKRGCLNRSDNVFSPYLFAATNGNVYLCCFRLTPSLGNLLTDSWDTVAKNIKV